MFVDANENQDAGDDIKVTDEELKGVKLFEDIDPEAITPDQARSLIKTGKTLLVQKKNWREKATNKPAPAAPAPIINPQPDAQQPEVVQQLQTSVKRLESVEQKRQFGHANSLSPEETDEVFAYAQGAGIQASEALKKPFMQSALQALREQSRANGVIPGPSGRSPMVDGKPFHELKREDKIKNFGKFVEAKRNR